MKLFNYTLIKTKELEEKNLFEDWRSGINLPDCSNIDNTEKAKFLEEFFKGVCQNLLNVVVSFKIDSDIHAKVINDLSGVEYYFDFKKSIQKEDINISKIIIDYENEIEKYKKATTYWIEQFNRISTAYEKYRAEAYKTKTLLKLSHPGLRRKKNN